MSFFKKYKNRMIVTIVAIILIIVIGKTSGNRLSLTKIERTIGNVLVPIERFFYRANKKTTDFFISIKNIGSLKSENEKLKIQISELEEKNRHYENLVGKSEILEKEAKLLETTEYKLIPTEITGREPGNWFDRFTVDKGTKDGVKIGDTVVQAVESDNNIIQEGIVGRVVEVGDTWSKVISIIDENSKISFKVIRTQDGGVISGNMDNKDNKDNKLTGYLFDSKADVMKGDKLFTSGLGGKYVKDLYIGEIVDVVKRDEDLMKSIYIEPAIDFKKIYKVYIVSN
ncbi:MAG: rod shape-determining protein MreC [Tissierellia bacterium]|nr:rod shape-determining protein MreC [Tissierellia bacterium]